MVKNPIWLKQTQGTVNRILELEPKYHAMSDKHLKHKTVEFRNRLSHGTKLDKLLPEAFATVREAARRTVELEHYPVQLLCGIALAQGKIAEQKTGEGKTLSATLPAYLYALTGKGVHVVTVNDYLTGRDAAWMGKVYEFLGLSVGVIISGMSEVQRKEAYACDITYVTNSELGFDYLRDNMAPDKNKVVQRGLNFAIIDEADSILIDAARTPLIISGGAADVSSIYTACNAVVKKLIKGKQSKEFNRMDALVDDLPEESGDFIVHEKEHTVHLTTSGVKKVEHAFGIVNYSDEKNTMLRHVIKQCLHANYLMRRDKDYVVKNGEVHIVDEFTGRILEGHQYSDGLQQAVEAKERVPIKTEARTVATVTYQSFFKKYKKICGMTGTAYSVRRELLTTYGVKTVVIPPNKKVIRKDKPCVMYLSRESKYKRIIREIQRANEKGQPVLVGTASVRASEELDYRLSLEGIPHQVLNAKQDEKEAEVIANAGIHGTVTVATNMAGRGTDIILDEEAKKAGGLKVIGTELHESVRIDNQLRGRSGRQGDPGESIFIVSTQDRLIRLYAGDKIGKRLEKVDDGKPLPRKMSSYYAHHAQQVIEDNLYGERKSVLDFDKVNDGQRELVYRGRREILNGKNIDEKMRECIASYVSYLEDTCGSAEDMVKYAKADIRWLRIPEADKLTGSPRKRKKELSSLLKKQLLENYEECKTKSGKMEKEVLLKAVDAAWMEQIRALECLRQGIGYVGFGQIKPENAYALEAYRVYERMLGFFYSKAVSLYFAEGVKTNEK